MNNENYPKSIECSKPYCGIPDKKENVIDLSGNREGCSDKHNIKNDGIYDGIEVLTNEWMDMACDEAVKSVKSGGGPFGAVLVQVDDETNEVLRYWKTHNTVTLCNDPTAHAEVNVIRTACRELGIFNLGNILREESSRTQIGASSHCEIYSSTEPCPMCYSAIFWARIPVLVFGATRFDAATPGVEFSDQELYDEFNIAYSKRTMVVRQATTYKSLDPFNLWKLSDVTKY